MLVQLPDEQRPTHVRYWVVVFAVTLAVVTYIDRVCISFAARFIRAMTFPPFKGALLRLADGSDREILSVDQYRGLVCHAS